MFDALISGIEPVFVIDLRGELTLLAEDVLVGAFHEASERGATSIVLDFTGVEFMNSAGISLVITILTEARTASQVLLFAGVSPHYHKIFSMLGLDRYVPIFATVNDALASI